MEVRVKVAELSARVTSMTTEEIDLLKQCHKGIFENILKIGISSKLDCSFDKQSSNILIVPINVWQMETPPLAHIDFDMVEKVLETYRPATCLKWPFPSEDTVVTKVYHQSDEELGLLEVVAVNREVKPTHAFPDGQYQSYSDYFRKRYDVHIADIDQPALECKKIGFSESRLRLITSRFRNTHGVEMDKSESGSSHNSTENLFAEVTCLYPLPAGLVKVIRCLPSMLYRIESLLTVDDLRSEVTLDTGVGRIKTTCTRLRGYEDYGLGKLETRWSLDHDAVAVTCPCSECSPYDDGTIVRGPGNAFLLQAVTLKSANDSIDNERLETLGDSFLKLATSVFLYCERPRAYEGRLTSARMRRIGNLNLFRLAKRKKMMGKILSKKFVPTGGWIPPCYTFSCKEKGGSSEPCDAAKANKLSDAERQYVYHRVTDKGAADFAESLIGAYLVAGGMEAAIQFMKWIGLKITRSEKMEHGGEATSQEMSDGEPEGSSSESLDVPRSKRCRQSPDQGPLFDEDANLLIHDSPQILQRHFGPAPPSFYKSDEKGDVVMKLLQCSPGCLEHIQREVHWTFRDKALLLQALTHASYQRNTVTDCYQRLEFLGDAVLDYLITTQIYEKFPDFDPGKITDMRSALVNNNLFAELAVKLKLHKAFLHQSPTLFKLIPEYERFITSTTHHDQVQDDHVNEVHI